MRVCVIGTGYVGLVTGACLAEKGNSVVCVDIDESRVEMLLRGEVPFFEPHLEDLVVGNSREGRLGFSTNLPNALDGASVVLLAVGTPSDTEGNADLSAIQEACRQIAETAEESLVVAIKSTVPVGTAKQLQAYFGSRGRDAIRVCSNPEFLKQGHAVNDFLFPERIVVGSDDAEAFNLLRELYQPFLISGSPILPMDSVSAELTKYVANAFLATKISFINEMSRMCEDLGGDIERVKAGVSTDSRIGPQFLNPGIGFGGSCLPKDLRALVYLSRIRSLETPLIEAVLENNELQKRRFVDRILDSLHGYPRGGKVGVWGLSFKPGTDDVRDAPALYLIDRLLEAGHSVAIYDPKAKLPRSLHALAEGALRVASSPRDACLGAHLLVLVTEWTEFRRPNWREIAEAMERPFMADGRNLYDPAQMRLRGFGYFSIGRL